MQEKKPRKKYVSVRKALHELKVNEKELDKIIEEGGIKAYKENTEVKFDADELEKYRASRKGGDGTEEVKIADESLYETMDGSFDSLFVSQNTSNVSPKVVGHASIEEIPKEPDVPFDPKDAVPKKKGNIKDYLKQKKAKPISPIKAIHGSKINERNIFLLQILIFIIIVTVSVNTYLIIETTGTTSHVVQIKTTKIIEDDITPRISLTAYLVAKEKQKVYAQTTGVLETDLPINSKVSKNDSITIKASTSKWQIALKEANLHKEFYKYKMQKASGKSQREVEKISKLYKKISTNDANDIGNWLEKIRKENKLSRDSILKWLEKTRWEQSYLRASKEIELAQTKVPLSGKITKVFCQTDKKIQKGQPIIEISTNETAIEASLTTKSYRSIPKNAQAFIATEEKDYPVVINLVKTEENICILRFTSKEAIPSQKDYKVIIPVDKRKSLQVANDCIFYANDVFGNKKTQICLIIPKGSHHIAVPVDVQLGMSDGEYVEISGDVKDGDIVAESADVALSSLRYNQEVKTK